MAETSDYSWKEMMAVVFARDLEDGERVTCGAHTEITFAAAMLAQKLYAPNIKLQLGGNVFLCNVVDIPVKLPLTSMDYQIMRWAEAAYDHPYTFHYFSAPGGRKYYDDPELQKSTNKYFCADKFFVGGLQADKYGNVNLIGIGSPGHYQMRGAGTVGICDLQSVKDIYIFLTAHERRRLPERVDFISMHGKRGYKEYHLLGHGPKWIVTPKAIFDFDEETDLARLKAVFPGVSVEDVLENTGFEPIMPARVETVEPPRPEELRVLRSEIDPEGALQK